MDYFVKKWFIQINYQLVYEKGDKELNSYVDV